MKKQFCYYRGHLCYIYEEFLDDEVTLDIIAEQMTDGTYGGCDCARSQFVMVCVPQSERFNPIDVLNAALKGNPQ